MAHGGRPLWMEEAFFILRRHPNVYLELSGIPPAKLLEYFPRLTDIAHKTIWGTDWPSPGVHDLRKNLDAFRALPLSAGSPARHPVGHQPSPLPDPRPLILSRRLSRCVPSSPSPSR